MMGKNIRKKHSPWLCFFRGIDDNDDVNQSLRTKPLNYRDCLDLVLFLDLAHIRCHLYC